MAKTIEKEKNFLSIITCVQNDEKKIKDFLLFTDSIFKEKFEAYEFIIVDNNSEDGTKKIIENIASEIHGNLTIVDLAWVHSLENAMLAGIDLAIGDFLMEFDTVNIDYSAETVMDIYYKCLEGFDVVAASPKGNSNFSSKLFYRQLRSISYRKMDLRTESFRIISRRALNRIMKSSEKIRYRKAAYHYSGFNTSILLYSSSNYSNKSNLRFSDKINLALDVLVNYSDFATKSVVNISLFFIFLTLVSLGYTIYSYLTYDNIQSGWTTIMIFLSGSFAGVFAILAVLAKYLTSIIIEIQDKPKYTYRGLDRISKKKY